MFLAVGELRRPHGVRGELRMAVLTDFPERIRPGIRLYVGPERRPLRVRTCRPAAEFLLVSFEGYPDRETVEALVNQVIFVRADDRPRLPEGEYYHHQLLGLAVVAEDGQPLGALAEILATGANDVYVVATPDGREILLPAIDEVILNIDLQQGQMRVHLLPGLIEGGEAA